MTFGGIYGESLIASTPLIGGIRAPSGPHIMPGHCELWLELVHHHFFLVKYCVTSFWSRALCSTVGLCQLVDTRQRSQTETNTNRRRVLVRLGLHVRLVLPNCAAFRPWKRVGKRDVKLTSAKNLGGEFGCCGIVGAPPPSPPCEWIFLVFLWRHVCQHRFLNRRVWAAGIHGGLSLHPGGRLHVDPLGKSTTCQHEAIIVAVVVQGQGGHALPSP